jgi:hypothetical protein
MVELADIVRRYGDAYRKTRRLPLNQLRTLRAIEICRTKELGGHVDECEDCRHIRISYNSCRNRHCPKCQFLTKEKWLHAREKELLPVPYFHIVFTVPSELNPLALRNQEVVYSLLFKAASETLLELTRTRLKAQIGVIAVLHTWGQNLYDHPHLHCIVTGGGLSQHRWISTKRKFFLPVKVMSRLFKGKLLSFIKKALDVDINGLYSKEWVIYCKPPFNGPASVIQYLGRYTHRVAITNHRIISADNEMVSFSWKDYSDGNRKKTMTLDADEFIRRFLLHVLPDRFVKIRYFGFLANRNRKACLERCRTLLKAQCPPVKLSETWQETLCRTTGIDINLCPLCHGKMRVKEAIAPYRGPP